MHSDGYGTTDDRKKYLPLLDLKLGVGDHTIDRLTRACSLKTGFTKNWSKIELVEKTDKDAHLPKEAQEFYVFAQHSSFTKKIERRGNFGCNQEGDTKRDTADKALP